MKILNEIARLTAPNDDLSIEELVSDFPKKEEILRDWKSWKETKLAEER